MRRTLRQVRYYFKSKFLLLRKLHRIVQDLPLLQVCIGITIGAMVAVTSQVNLLLVTLLLILLLRKGLVLIPISMAVFGLLCIVSNQTLSEVMNYQLESAFLVARVVEPVTENTFADTVVIQVSDGKKFLLQAPKFSGYTIGNNLEVTVSKFENLMTLDTGYATYLASKGIYGIVGSDSVDLIGNNSTIYTAMNNARIRFGKVIKSNLLPPESDLLQGILVGERASLSEDFKAELQVSGLMHVIAVSGFNVMLIANFLNLLCGLIPRKICYMITLVLIWLFLVLVGVENLPALRAVIMLSIMYAGLLIGRKVPMLLCLLYSSTIMIIFNPLVWLNISWQLSFAAMLGVVIFSSILTSFMEMKSEIGNNFITTVAVILTTGPISFLSFGSFSLVGLVSNILVVPFVPIITMLGLISLVSSAVPNLANFIFQAVELVLKLMVQLIRLMGSVEGGVVRDSLLAFGIVVLMSSIVLIADFKLFTRSVEQRYA